jgi:hypothetical protein
VIIADESLATQCILTALLNVTWQAEVAGSANRERGRPASLRRVAAGQTWQRVRDSNPCTGLERAVS